jgi:hypothetical protein
MHKEEIKKLKVEKTLFESKLDEKNESMEKEKQKALYYQHEFEKLQLRFNECNNYISKLPTIDEFKENEIKV